MLRGTVDLGTVKGAGRVYGIVWICPNFAMVIKEGLVPQGAIYCAPQQQPKKDVKKV